MQERNGMIKVVRIITRLNIGGPAMHVILLSSSLNSSGLYKDILVCGRVSESEGDMNYLAKEKGVRPLVVPELVRDIDLKNDFKAFLKLLAIIKKEKPDIIHTHTAKAGALGRLAAIFAGVPVKIHTFHGHIFDGYFSPGKARFFLYVERFLALFTSRIAVVSDRIKDEIVHELKVTNESKGVVIPLGLEFGILLKCEEKKGLFRRKFSLPEDAMLVGIVGRLVPIKNHRMFVDAARVILNKDKAPCVKFLIIGDGELKSSLEGYVKSLGLEDHIIFTGWVDDLASVYAGLDIVALTSLNEGTPVSLIEAMASAKPVLATDVGGVRDLIQEGKNGLMVDTNDVNDFANKLLRLIEDYELRRRLGEYGREYVIQRYSDDRLVKNIKNLYEGCLNKR